MSVTKFGGRCKQKIAPKAKSEQDYPYGYY